MSARSCTSQSEAINFSSISRRAFCSGVSGIRQSWRAYGSYSKVGVSRNETLQILHQLKAKSKARRAKGGGAKARGATWQRRGEVAHLLGQAISPSGMMQLVVAPRSRIQSARSIRPSNSSRRSGTREISCSNRFHRQEQDW